jgi:hypothetical protein
MGRDPIGSIVQDDDVRSAGARYAVPAEPCDGRADGYAGNTTHGAKSRAAAE